MDEESCDDSVDDSCGGGGGGGFCLGCDANWQPPSDGGWMPAGGYSGAPLYAGRSSGLWGLLGSIVNALFGGSGGGGGGEDLWMISATLGDYASPDPFNATSAGFGLGPIVGGGGNGGNGHGNTSGGSQQPANKAQAKCSAKIQAAVQSDLNPTSLTNLGPTSGPGLDSNGMRGGAFNVNFFESGVTLGPPATATAIPGTTCGRFNDGLHIPIPGAPGCPNLNDPTIFTGQPAVYNGASGFFFTGHIDSGNANTFFGALRHFFIDVFGGNLGFHHGC